MASSGTVGQAVYDITTLVEHAFRRCGKMPSTVSSEQQLGALESLQFLLTSLVNKGLTLWCVQTNYLMLQEGQSVYSLPSGTADVLNVALRTESLANIVSTTYTNNTGDPLNPGYAWRALFDLGASQQVSALKMSVGPELIADPRRTYTLYASTALGEPITQVGQTTLQISSDGASAYLTLDPVLSSQYWLLQDDSETVSSSMFLTFAELRYNPSDIPSSPFNRDDYFNMPNKEFRSDRPLQYWYEKAMEPRLTLWPVPNASDKILVVQTHRQVQDVGSTLGYGGYTATLEVPQRWYEYVVFALACKVALEIPPGELPPGRLEYLEGKAAEELDSASDGENDGAPLRIQPNLRGYTR